MPCEWARSQQGEGPDIEFEEGAIINETAPGVASDFIFNSIQRALEPGGVEAVAAASARAQATAARTQDRRDREPAAQQEPDMMSSCRVGGSRENPIRWGVDAEHRVDEKVMGY